MSGNYSKYPPASGGGGGAVDSVNGLTGVVVLTTTQITEGTRLYYTNARVNTQLTTPGPIGSVTPNTGAFTTLSASSFSPSGPIIMIESADFTTGGYLFGESGNDTGFTSPSDGVIYQYGNSAIGSKWESIGPTEIRGVPIFFPTGQGAAGSVLTNAGDGNLSWSAIPPLALPQNLTESFDPNNLSSTRFNIVSSVAPIAPSASSDITEFQVYTDNFSAFSINGVWSMRASNQNLGSANVGYNGLLQGSQTIGNGTDPITLSQVYGVSANTFVQAGSTASSVSLYEHTFGSAVGSSVGPFSFSRSTGSVDHFTSSVEHYLAGMQIATVDGDARAFIAQDNITTANNNVTAYSDNTQVGNMPTVNTGYVTFNSGPNIPGSVGGFTSLSTHPQVGSVVTDFSAWEDGSNITTVGRNVNYVNHHPNIATVIDNYTGWGASPHVTTHHGSFTDLSLNSLVDSLDNNYQGVNVSPRMTAATPAAYDVTVTPAADVAGSMAGAYFGVGIPYSVGGDNFTPWLKVSGVGTAPGGQPNPIEVDVATNDSAATIATAIVAAMVAYGTPFDYNSPNPVGISLSNPAVISVQNTFAMNAPVKFSNSGGSLPASIVAGTVYYVIAPTSAQFNISATPSGAPIDTSADLQSGTQLISYLEISLTDLGGSLQIVANTTGAANKIYNQANPTLFTYVYATYGAGGGTATGVNINMSQVVGYDPTQGRLQAINFNQGTFSGNMTFPFTNVPNPQPINSINVGFTVPASTSVTNADTFAFATLQQFTLEHDAHVTSGGLGVGSVGTGAIGLMQLDDSSTIADVAGCFFAFLPVGGTGAGGVVGMVHGYEFAGLPGAFTGSPTTITNAKAFEARAPDGTFTTSTAWGFYAEAAYDQNFMGGNLKIGPGGDTALSALHISGESLFYHHAPGAADGGLAIREQDSNTGGFPVMEIMGSNAAIWTNGTGLQFRNDTRFISTTTDFSAKGGFSTKTAWLGTSGIGSVEEVLGITATTGNVYQTAIKYASSPYPDVTASASNFYFNTKVAAAWPDGAGFVPYGTTALAIKDDGKIGVGTAAPAETLDVQGSAIFNGNLGFYNTTPITQPTSSGAATAGAVYTATEQTMLQEVYNACRALGIMS